MTHPGTTPEGFGPSSLPPSEAATWLQARMQGSGAERMVRYLRRTRTGARILMAVVLVIGVTGLALGLLTWRATPTGLVVVVLLSAPGVVGPLMLARRVTALARAVAHPEQVVAQARDLCSQLRSSPELDELTHRLGGLHGKANPIQEMGRIRKAVGLASHAAIFW